MLFESLPVDLIAEILGELDLESLIMMSYLSKRFYLVASDPSLNPWRRPIKRNLSNYSYEKELKHLSVRTTVPRHNWVEILASARPSFILYEATLPHLGNSEWEECFQRRFLPSWAKWKKDSSWKEAYLKVLHRIWHRGMTSCTADESWTKYIVLNRNGSANELEASSRNFNPGAVFNEMKLQSNLSHLETRVRVGVGSIAKANTSLINLQLVVQLADIRILAFGTLTKPRTNRTVNPNARIFLNPPGIMPDSRVPAHSKRTPNPRPLSLVDDHGIYPLSATTMPAFLLNNYHNPSKAYTRLSYPQPWLTHHNYPLFTPGGHDLRWAGSEEIEEHGLHWVGSLMIIAQLLGPSRDFENAAFSGHQYASFDWNDLLAISPWMEEFVTKKVDGAGLGH